MRDNGRLFRELLQDSDFFRTAGQFVLDYIEKLLPQPQVF